MPTKLRVLPGLEVVGRGVYLRPGQPPRLKSLIFSRGSSKTYYSAETGLTYELPAVYEVNDSPPMPATQALNQVLIEETWDRFEKRTSLSASVAASNGPFSVDVNASQAGQLRQEEEAFYALRTSFIPLWSVYIPSVADVSDDSFDIAFPVPFDPKHRNEYARFFERFGTHYVTRAWVGGKASLALTITKQTQMTRSEITAGIKASMIGAGSASLTTSDQQSRDRLQSNSQCTVFGKGGDELKLASLSTLDSALYDEWLATVKHNPQVIEIEVLGIWTLLHDRDRAEALADAYREETLSASLRVVFNLDNRIHFFEASDYYTYDLEREVTSAPVRVSEHWPDLFRVGFECVDAGFLGDYLVSQEGEDLSRKLFMFNRDRYVRWDVDKKEIDPGYPRLICEGWPGVTFERIDAAVNVTPQSVYFFSGSHYIRFNNLRHVADPGYPDIVSRRWAGLTFDRIDAATYWGNGKVYFFSGNQYIRYDTVMWRADPGYPRFIIGRYVEDWKFLE